MNTMRMTVGQAIVRFLDNQYLEFDGVLLRSTVKFLVSGVVLAAVLWLAARFAALHLAELGAFRDEATLAVLTVVGTIVYAGSILLLFGRRWLVSLVRS